MGVARYHLNVAGKHGEEAHAEKQAYRMERHEEGAQNGGIGVARYFFVKALC